MQHDILNTSIDYLKGVGPKRGEVLKSELGIYTYLDLLCYFPFRYIDRSSTIKVNQIQGANTRFRYDPVHSIMNYRLCIRIRITIFVIIAIILITTTQ